MAKTKSFEKLSTNEYNDLISKTTKQLDALLEKKVDLKQDYLKHFKDQIIKAKNKGIALASIAAAISDKSKDINFTVRELSDFLNQIEANKKSKKKKENSKDKANQETEQVQD